MTRGEELVSQARELSSSETHSATQEHIAKCMAERGFEYTPQPKPTNDADPDPSTLFLMTDTRAQTDAYNITQQMMSGPGLPDEIRVLGEEEARQYSIAMFDDASGCVIEAQQALTPAAIEVYEELDALGAEFVDRVIARSETTELFRTWERCMATRGYQGLESPHQMRHYAYQQMTPLVQQDFRSNARTDSFATVPQAAIAISDELLAVEQDIAIDDAACTDEIRDELAGVLEAEKTQLFGSAFSE